MTTLLQDLNYTLRILRKSPAFTFVVLLTLALGLGASTAIFSVVNTVLLRPLPYDQPDRLVRLYELREGRGQGAVSVPNFRDWRKQSGAFEDLAAYAPRDVTLQGVDDAIRLSSLAVTANLFSLLGVQPRLGRGFLPGDDEAGAPVVVVLSYALWAERFGGDPDVIGQTILLDGEAHTVVGVMPEDFQFPAGGTPRSAWVPLRVSPDQAESRGTHWLAVIGRLRSGVRLDMAQDEMSRIAARLAELYPDSQEGRSAMVVSLREDVVGDLRPALLVLLGAAGFVLLIVCANAANLLLARSTARRREIAVRTALGASHGRTVRQFLTEALLLAATGAAIGLLLAHFGVGLVRRLAGTSLPRADEIGLDAGVFAFVLAVTSVVAVGFGLAPALQAARARPTEELREGSGKTTAGRVGQRLRSTLVIAQMALSLVLLVGAGLMLRTFAELMGTDTGMVTQNVLTLKVAVPVEEYPGGRVVQGFYEPVLERVRSLPGVRAAGWISHLPLEEWGTNGTFRIEGAAPSASPADQPSAEWRFVSDGYFAALGIPLQRGRTLISQDVEADIPVAVVNQALAERYFPGGAAVGRRARDVGIGSSEPTTFIGVVGNVRQAELNRDPLPEAYLPYSDEVLAILSSVGLMTMHLVVSTDVAPTSLTSAVRSAIRSVDPSQPVFGVQTMDQVVGRSIADRRLYLWLLAVFAGVALSLATAGIYGVVAYAVTQRTREIGIRVALGARSASVLGLVLRQGATLALGGLALGLPAALALTRLIASLLYGVGATDPVTFGSVAVLLVLVALIASYVPARRAARVDPMIALRAE